MSRRSVLGAGGLAAAVLGSGIAQLGWLTAPSATLAGVKIRSWGCQYQNISIDAIQQTDLDLVVLDQVIDGRQIEFSVVRSLQRKSNGKRRLVLAYLSVGEAESYRSYWQPQWRQSAPSWVGRENRNWPGSYAVRYWDPAWKQLLIGGEKSLLQRAFASGFDGVFLDRVDAYGDWSERGELARAEMIKLVGDVSREAKLRQNNFIIMAQNAEPCLLDPLYRASIDAVSKESLLFGLSGPEHPNSEQDVSWSLNHLRRATDNGLPVFAIEYLSSANLLTTARTRLRQLGFVPFFGSRLLDRVPV